MSDTSVLPCPNAVGALMRADSTRSTPMDALRQRFSHYLPILGYHRVGEALKDHVPTVRTECFRRQIEFLRREKYSVLDIAEIADRIDAGKPLPRRNTVVTFDDGYAETWTIAWPILKASGFPATVFITPAEIGLPGFMNWNQVVAASREGFTIGCHTMNHSYLPLVPEDRLRHELMESKQLIESRIGRSVDYLSYPVGGFTRSAQAIAQEAGYRLACTTNRHGFAPSAGLDRFALRRVKVTDKDAHGFLFRAKLSGYYNAFRQLKAPA